MIVAGGLITAAGVYWLSRIPVHGSYVSEVLPGMVLVAIGVGPVFVGVTTTANAGVPADKAGLAASLAAAVIGVRATNTRGEAPESVPRALPEPVRS